MKRLLNILVFCCLSMTAFAQEETRVVDSLLSVLEQQQGRDKVLTMIELTWEFYDVSYDDCIDWGERAIAEAKKQGFEDLEANALYALGMQYGYNGDLDLAEDKLREAFRIHKKVGNESGAFEDIWNQAHLEQNKGNVDTALSIYQEVLLYAEERSDSLAMAQVYFNMATGFYQKRDFASADRCLTNSIDLYRRLNDTIMVIRAQANLANNYMESGKYSEARNLFRLVISRMEEIGDYVWLMIVYKNYGQLFVKDCINFDSASYYYEKAYLTGDFLVNNGFDVPISEIVEIIVEMGNTDYNMGNYEDAIKKYNKAIELSEPVSYVTGKMLAYMGLGLAYSQLARPSESLRYLDLFFDMEEQSGITIAHSSTKFPLMLNYARLGRLDELESELKDVEDEFNGLLRENADIYDQLQQLRDETADLLAEHDSQNQQIETLQAERNQYRLAFFGLLAIALFALVLLIAYKIVRKKRAQV